MKNIHLLIASVLCLGTTSCFDMNQEPQGEMSTVGAFTTTSEINMYLNMFYQGSVPVMGGGTVNNTASRRSPAVVPTVLLSAMPTVITCIRTQSIRVWPARLRWVTLPS